MLNAASSFRYDLMSRRALTRGIPGEKTLTSFSYTSNTRLIQMWTVNLTFPILTPREGLRKEEDEHTVHVTHRRGAGARGADAAVSLGARSPGLRPAG